MVSASLRATRATRPSRTANSSSGRFTKLRVRHAQAHTHTELPKERVSASERHEKICTFAAILYTGNPQHFHPRTTMIIVAIDTLPRRRAATELTRHKHNARPCRRAGARADCAQPRFRARSDRAQLRPRRALRSAALRPRHARWSRRALTEPRSVCAALRPRRALAEARSGRAAR